MLCTLRTKQDSRKWCCGKSFRSFPVGTGSAREEKEEKKYAPPSEEILKVFHLILTGLAFWNCCLFLWILARLNKNRLSEAASCCLPSPPHLYKSNTESGLSYCSVFLCFLFYFRLCLPPVLRTTPAHPCHFRVISPRGFQILTIFQVSLNENVRTDYFSWSQYPFIIYFHQASKNYFLLNKMIRTARPDCTHSPISSDQLWCWLGHAATA